MTGFPTAIMRRQVLIVGGCVMLLLPGFAIVAPAVAQIGVIGGPTAPEIFPPPVGTGRLDLFAKPERAEDALPMGDWLIYPSAFGGAMYDTNVNQASTGVQASPGFRLVPSLLAETYTGLSKTSLYGMADGRIYTSQGASSANDVVARSGVVENYQPLEDLLLTGQADYTRQKDLFDTLGVTNSVQSLNPTGVGLSPTTSPASYNQFSGTVAVQKNFADAFAILSGSVVSLMYDTNSETTAPSPNGVTYTGTLRGGLWITPALYGYTEGTVDLRNQSTASLSSSGYRTLAGLGTDQIGLFRGEVFGGYQSETYQSSAIGTTSGLVAGVRGYYFPLPELTVNLVVDESLGVSLLTATPTSPAGTSTRVTTALATAGYSVSQRWWASGRTGYIHTDYVDAVRRDDSWTIGGTIIYSLAPNVGLTLDYQHVELSSNAALQAFSRDVVTIGATYKY